MAELVKTFLEEGEFEACRAAEKFLESAGFSVGRMQRGDPRGILFGDYDIQKWRNLRKSDRDALHGKMIGNMRSGRVTVIIFESAPPEAQRDFLKVADQYANAERASA